MVYNYCPLSYFTGGLINRGVGSPLHIGNLGGANKLRWVEICKRSLNWGYILDLGSHSYVTNCEDEMNHGQLRDTFKSLIRLGRVNPT